MRTPIRILRAAVLLVPGMAMLGATLGGCPNFASFLAGAGLGLVPGPSLPEGGDDVGRPTPPVSAAFIIDTETSEAHWLTVEREGEAFVVLGEKNSSGNLTSVKSISYQAQTDAPALTIYPGEDGLPSLFVVEGFVVQFGNWRDNAVDLTVTTPSGETRFFPDAALEPGMVSELQDLGLRIVQAAGPASSSGAKTLLRSSDSTQTIATILKYGALAYSAIKCGGAIYATVQTGGVGFPLLAACGSLALSIIANFTPETEDNVVASTIGVTACVVGGWRNDPSRCVAPVAGLIGNIITHNEAHAATAASYTARTGFFRGVVRSAGTRVPISEARVSAVQGGHAVSGDLTDASGRYEIALPAGTDYRLEVSKDGYLPVSYFGAEVAARQTAELETLLQIESRYVGSGTISGTVTNAFDGTAVSDALIRFRSGQNARQGAVVFSATTNSAGLYEVSAVQSGVYTGEVTGSGFLTGYFTVTVLGGTTVGDQNIGLSPQLTAEEIRIVLTWGPSPDDLDSHLTGPRFDGTRFHVYFSDRGNSSSEPYAALDHDDTTSYGPETITIYTRRSGTYRYTVHDYSNRSSTSSMALANSGAEVKVYGEAGLVATFSVPPEGGTAWTVFELDGDSGAVTPINAVSYVSNPSDISQRARVRTMYDLGLLQDLPAK